MAKRYRLVVIGTGTAAMVAAMRVRAGGWSVAVVDFRPYGGTCALRGCDPKKMLVGGATAVDHARRMRGKGVGGDSWLDWPDLMAFKRGFTGPVPQKHQLRYAAQGIDTYHGRARFTGRNTVEIHGQTLDAEHILIAAGAEPIKLGIPGEEHLVTSEGFLELESLPRRIVIVGGGHIAFEFAHLARRAGAEVTVLNRSARVLGSFDPDLVGWLVDHSRNLGITVRTNTEVDGIERDGQALVVHAAANGNRERFLGDLVVHAAGRAPALDELGLDAAGIGHERGRLRLNAFLAQ